MRPTRTQLVAPFGPLLGGLFVPNSGPLGGRFVHSGFHFWSQFWVHFWYPKSAPKNGPSSIMFHKRPFPVPKIGVIFGTQNEPQNGSLRRASGCQNGVQKWSRGGPPDRLDRAPKGGGTELCNFAANGAGKGLLSFGIPQLLNAR